MGRTGNKGEDKCRAVRLDKEMKEEMGKVKMEFFFKFKDISLL